MTNRAVALGAACCALSAGAGVYLGEAFGLLVPLGAALAGGAVLGLFAADRTRESQSRPRVSNDAAAPVPAGQAPAEPRDATAVSVEPSPEIQQGPAETHEVQLKLDLARSYLEIDEAGLAIPLLQEILETELAVAARLESDAVRETR